MVLANQKLYCIQMFLNIEKTGEQHLPDDKNLDWSKLKKIADDISKYI